MNREFYNKKRPVNLAAHATRFTRRSTNSLSHQILLLPPGLKKYIPKGYEVLDQKAGDLNLDAYPDLILILKKSGEEKTSEAGIHPEKRPLLIFTGKADKSYSLEARNDNAVYCVDCGGMMGDPYQNIEIDKGKFSVGHYGGSADRWVFSVTFRYSPAEKSWFLFKEEFDYFNVSDPDNSKSKVLTSKKLGRVPFKKFDIYKETI